MGLLVPKPSSEFKGIPKVPDMNRLLEHTETRDAFNNTRQSHNSIWVREAKAEVHRFLEGLKQTLEELIGHRGNYLDRAVTVRDLIDAGMVKYLNDADTSVTHPDRGVYPTDPPNPPLDLEWLQRDSVDALTSMQHHLQWVNATNTNGDIVATQVWCSVGNDSRSNATLIGIVTLPNNWYVNSNPDPDEHHYYWIRHVNWAGAYSVWEPTAIQGGLLITKEDTIDNTVAAMLAALQGEDFETAYSAGTEYTTGDRVKSPDADSIDRNFVCVKDEPNIMDESFFDAVGDWAEGDGWDIDNGVATCDGTQVAASELAQSPTVAEVDYTFQFTLLVRDAGTVTPYVGDTAGTARSTPGTYIETITCGDDTADTYLEADASFEGVVDNVIVARVSGGAQGITGMSPEDYWPRWWKRTGVISIGTLNGEDVVGIDGNLIVSGTIDASRVQVSSGDGRTRLDGDSITVYDENNTLRVKLGRLT